MTSDQSSSLSAGLAAAIACRASGDLAGMLRACRDVLQRAPGHREAELLLADGLIRSGDGQGALDAVRGLLLQAPDLAPAWLLFAQACTLIGDRVTAEAAFRRCLQLAPDDATAFNGLGTLHLDNDEPEASLAYFRQALALQPQLPEPRKNLALALARLDRDAEAEATFQDMRHRSPGFRQGLMDFGIFLLSREFYGSGWDLYESRWGSGVYAERDWGLGLPRWDFGALGGRHLLAWGEQGLGDQILHGTMLPDLAARCGGRLTVSVTDRLVPLFARSLAHLGCDVVAHGAVVAADVQVPFGSLGRWLRRGPEDFPAGALAGRYLRADAGVTAGLRAAYQAAAPGCRIMGLSWRSGNPQLGSAKSVALSQLAPLFALPGISWVSLQYGDAGAEIAASGLPLRVDAGVDGLVDFDRQASQVAALDGVVSVSNTTVHLAAALGVGVDVLLPKGRGRLWYWPGSGRGSRWYGAARLWRQNTNGDWEGLVQDLCEDLAGRAQHG